tara:strand:- start:16 stop:396 length:381 start_codon:yes stop_codon:yes gene_type:complete
MDLILITNSLKLSNIQLKHSVKSIKIIYDLNYILILGMSLKLYNYNAIFSNNYIYITLNDPVQKKVLKDIDNHIKKLLEKPYQSFMKSDVIKVKNNKGYTMNDDIYISLNNIKEYDGVWKLHIFTI